MGMHCKMLERQSMHSMVVAGVISDFFFAEAVLRSHMIIRLPAASALSIFTSRCHTRTREMAIRLKTPWPQSKTPEVQPQTASQEHLHVFQGSSRLVLDLTRALMLFRALLMPRLRGSASS